MWRGEIEQSLRLKRFLPGYALHEYTRNLYKRAMAFSKVAERHGPED